MTVAARASIRLCKELDRLKEEVSEMSILLGLVILFGCIITGYIMHHGKIAVLMQPSEYIIIGGAGLGSVIVAFSFKGAIGILKGCISILKGNPYKRSTFLEALQCMYDLFMLGRKEGLIALEKHVEEPPESEVFQKYPSFLQNHHAVDLFSDSMKLVVMGGISTYDLSDLMEIDMEAQHEEAMKVPDMLATVGDAMPAFGIVAAVLGVVITMQSIGGPPEELGEKVAAALVGTFLGILLAYGVFMPMSKASENIAKTEAQYMACIKHAVVAYCRGDSPLICVEYARRNIEPELRPGFKELEDMVKGRSSSEGDGEATAEAA